MKSHGPALRFVVGGPNLVSTVMNYLYLDIILAKCR
jgi:hypothetical protein